MHLTFDEFKKIKTTGNYEQLLLEDYIRYNITMPCQWHRKFLQDDDKSIYYLNNFLPLDEQILMLDDLKMHERNELFQRLCIKINALEAPLTFLEENSAYLSETQRVTLQTRKIMNGTAHPSVHATPRLLIDKITRDIYNQHKSWWQALLTSDPHDLGLYAQWLTLSAHDTFLKDELEKNKHNIFKLFEKRVRERGNIPCKNDYYFNLFRYIKDMFPLQSRVEIFHIYVKNRLNENNINFFENVEEETGIWLPEYTDEIKSIINRTFEEYTELGDLPHGIQRRQQADILQKMMDTLLLIAPPVFKTQIAEKAQHITSITHDYISETMKKDEFLQKLFNSTFKEMEIYFD